MKGKIGDIYKEVVEKGPCGYFILRKCEYCVGGSLCTLALMNTDIKININPCQGLAIYNIDSRISACYNSPFFKSLKKLTKVEKILIGY